MIPKLVRLSRSAPKDRHKAWDQYWAGITATGPGGEVLWDSGSDHEFLGYKDSLLRYLDPALPVVDTGCGHGSFTRALAEVFPQVIGVDVSPHAVTMARTQSEGTANPVFEARDMTAPGAGAALAESIQAGVDGANVFIRGVLHVLDPAHQKALVENLRTLAGNRGTVFMAETNFHGNPVEYVSHLGATDARAFRPRRTRTGIPDVGLGTPGGRPRYDRNQSRDGRARTGPGARILRGGPPPAVAGKPLPSACFRSLVRIPAGRPHGTRGGP
jgi:SAM-dependent methyltransferase